LSEPRPVSISDVIVILTPPTDGFPDLRKVLRLALTVPVANVASGRSFSCTRKIRTFVRSNMKEDKLNTLSNLNIENDLTKDRFDKLIEIFARMPTLRDCTGVLGSDNAGKLDL
jgi:hAT family C-terminal dimerisation region